jgi:hypothetical protein
MRVVYLEPHDHPAPPPPYRTGEAGRVWLRPDGGLETEVRVPLSANSAHALIGHGVVDALNGLAIEGSLGDGQQVLLPPPVLEEATAIFSEADRRTYGGTWEFVAGVVRDPEPVEYRVRIDNREYQVTLARLRYLVAMASREGDAAWIRI